MKVLVTGAGGQLGAAVAAAFGHDGHHDVVACDRSRLDIDDRDAVLQAITAFGPDAVVNAAAYTDVDGAESEPDAAFRTNALAVRHLVDACRITGARLTHISTDMVFDGQKAGPYNEWDEPAPISAYGASKLGGEREVPGGHLVIRTSWVNGHGKSLVRTILALAGDDAPLRFVDDRWAHPTFVDDLADVVRRLVVARAAGLFHVTNQRAVTPFELAREVLAAAGLDAGRVEPISAADESVTRPAARPRNSVLDNAALRLQGWPLPADHQEPLERLVKELIT